MNSRFQLKKVKKKNENTRDFFFKEKNKIGEHVLSDIKHIIKLQ